MRPDLKNNPVDWNGRYETPAGIRVQGIPHRRKCAEEAPGPPAESECPTFQSTFIFHKQDWIFFAFQNISVKLCL